MVKLIKDSQDYRIKSARAELNRYHREAADRAHQVELNHVPGAVKGIERLDGSLAFPMSPLIRR